MRTVKLSGGRTLTTADLNRSGALPRDVMRRTGETDVRVTVDLDGTGKGDIQTGVGFFDHMLMALSRHSLVDMTVHVEGDTWVDDHHTVEDTGIALGQALREALGDKAGIRRFGDALVPLDEALVMAAVDFSGRGELFWDVGIGPAKVGSFDTELGHGRVDERGVPAPHASDQNLVVLVALAPRVMEQRCHQRKHAAGASCAR